MADEATLLLGCFDGCVRLVQICPNRIIGTPCVHEGQLPVTSICLSSDGCAMVTTAHSHVAKLWYLPFLRDDASDEPVKRARAGIVSEKGRRAKRVLAKEKGKDRRRATRTAFFEDM
ncbi:hypothetical protein KIPB_008115 [Kipferlia bialata]|uniref:Uncharacterized protein n=1 Tax=Kipferlia bialata TaxID=797122 RepID=A0A9K3D1X1_9EUKA|nr:hypothetical protein KIPB_003857 [Kipferlia bialata]GIQ86288.1 hypothetical protein KIPB_008115 [Kipferlia bialata]|eukprot:g3857.t1